VSRPDVVALVTGTGTDVGKTYVTAALARELGAAGVSVAARKPVQSFDPAGGPTDADVLAAATGETPAEVCPPHRWYPVPLAPPMAADALARPPIALGDLVGELTWPDATAVGLVEAVGGLRSPLAHDGDALALVAALDPDVVIVVADPALGAISNVRLACDALGDRETLVVLNRFDAADALHARNFLWLTQVDLISVVVEARELATAVRDRKRSLRSS
jgi:dethiobiotin synthetase